MASVSSKSERFIDDLEKGQLNSTEKHPFLSFMRKINWKTSPELRLENAKKVLSRVFSEEYDVVDKMVLDPRGQVLNRWNKVFLMACLISLFVDPLFFYLPRVKKDLCITGSLPLEIVLTITRSLVDVFYFIHVFIRLRTAYVAPSSRVFGRGELVIDPSKIASRYLNKDFWIDFVAAQPLPQLLIWAVIPIIKGKSSITTLNILRLVTLFQYLLRLYLTFPLSSQIVKASGVVTATAWAGAAYNLMLYMLASHVLGAYWYLLSAVRQQECWRKVCDLHQPYCNYGFFSCRLLGDPARAAWFDSSNITALCTPNAGFFEFGIHADALSQGVTSARFFNKYSYCLWWGLRNLSSLGQNLFTSTFVGEINFAIVIAIVGLVLFGMLIGNMHTYLRSTTMRLEEWRIRKTDIEEWMHHRHLPRELKHKVRRYGHYRWVATRGVDEESILKSLPVDIRRDIKRHLCLDLVRQVPLFDLMDDRMLDAICERLNPCLYTANTCLIHEGDPVNSMIFILRGRLDSYTTDGGRAGFFNSSRIGAGDFCGEELLTWALEPRPSIVLPCSTRTVSAITDVEAFALSFEDLRFVASQFRRLNSKRMRRTFRFHSHQWRTWAACFIQAAWFRYRRRKEAASQLKTSGNCLVIDMDTEQGPGPVGSVTVSYAAKLATSVKREGSRRCGAEFVEILSSLRKPNEPNFTADDG